MGVRTGELTQELFDILGEDRFFELVEAFGGTRLYVPFRPNENSKIVQELGLESAQALADRFAPDKIRVPIARELRVLRYRRQGLSHAKIASRLVMTEAGVDKVIRRHSEMLNPCP